MYAQGDILITPTDETNTKGLKLAKRDTRNRVILAEGEVTGHAHAIRMPSAKLYHDGAMARMLLKVPNGGKVEHEEHGTIDLPPGNYKVTRQNEYPRDEVRQVAD